MEKEIINNGFVEGQAIPPYNPMAMVDPNTESQIKDEAYYTVALDELRDEREDKAPAGIAYDKIIEDYGTMGMSATVNTAKQMLLEEDDEQIKQTIVGIIEDESVTPQDKQSILKSYTTGFRLPQTLKDKYVQTLSTMEAATSTEDDVVTLDMNLDRQKLIDSSIEVGESLHKKMVNFKKGFPEKDINTALSTKLLKSLADLQPGFTQFLDMNADELEDNDGFFYGLGVNASQLFNSLIVELPMFITQLLSVPAQEVKGSNLAGLDTLFLDENDKVKAAKNFTEMREYVEKVYTSGSKEKVYGLFNDYQDIGVIGDAALNWRDFWRTVMTVGGLVATEEEFDNYITQESITMSTFETIDEGFDWVAKKANPENPEAVKIPLEIASFFSLYGFKKGKAGVRNTKRRYDIKKAGYDVNVSRFLEGLDKSKIQKEGPIKFQQDGTTPLTWQEVFLLEKNAEGTPIINQNTLIDKVNDIPQRSPEVTTRVSNREISSELNKGIIIDETGSAAKKTGVTRTSIIALTFAPILGGILNKSKHVDLHEWSLQKRMYERLANDYFINEGFLFPEKRKTWIRDTDSILDDISAGVDIYQRNSDSIFQTKDWGLNTSIVFSKNADSHYKSLGEATDAINFINEKVGESGKKDFEIIIEHVDGNDAIIKSFKSIEEMNASPLFKKAVDTVENLEAKKKQLLFEASTSRNIRLNKKRVAAEAELRGVTPDAWLRQANRNASLREIEIKNIEKDLQIAKEVEGKRSHTPNIRVRINRDADYYDAAQQITDGFANPPKRGWWFTKALFDSRNLWKGISHFGTINTKLEAVMHNAGLRGSAWMKDSLQSLQKDINKLSKSGRNDVALLYKKSLDYKDYLDVNDITTMLDRPNLDLNTAYLYQKIITKTRAINQFRYNAENVYEINRLQKQGYDTSFKNIRRDDEGNVLVDSEGKQLTENIIAKELTAAESILNKEHAFDFSKNQSIDNRFVGQQKIYRLAKVYFDKDGHAFEYGIFGEQQPSVLPQLVIPSRTGHMPAIMKGSHFVRMYPKEFTLNGVTRTYEGHIKNGGTLESWMQEMKPYGRAVMVSPTGIGANRWLRNNVDAWARESNINVERNFFEIELASELKNIDRIEANVIREEAMRASRQRSDIPIAKAMYEDTLASFVVTTEANGSRAYMQPLLNEYKARYMKEYGDKFIEAIDDFPKEESQIKMKDGFERLDSIALKEFRQIMVLEQGYQPNWIGRMLQKGASTIARYSEESATTTSIPLLQKAIEKALPTIYEVAKKPSLLQNSPMRVTSILKIQWQVPWWHYMIQTANSFGHLAVGGYAGFNIKTIKNYIKTASDSARVVHMITRNNISAKKYAKELEVGLDWMAENDAKILGKTDDILNLSKQDIALIINNGRSSGFFHIADHTFAKNFWKQGPKQIEASKTTAFFGKTNEKIGQIGFEQGELMGRVNTWMAARIDWVQKHPGMNWRSAKALDEINSGARKLAGSMDQFGEMGIQRVPVLATFAQFSSFIFKSSEGLWNTSATPFTPKQMAALTAWNTVVYGVRGGVWYGMGAFVFEIYKQLFGEDVATEQINKLDDLSLLNITINRFSDAMMPTYDEEGNLLKSDLEFNLRFSPMGADMPFGGYGAVWEAIFRDNDAGGITFGPSGQLISDIVGKDSVLDMLQAIWSRPNSDINQTQDQIIASLEAVSKLTGLTSAITRAILSGFLEDKRSKLGQLRGLNLTKAEKWLWGWSSVQGKAERLAFENFTNAKNKDEANQELAEGIYKGMVMSLGRNPNMEELITLQRGLKYTLHGSDYLDEERYWEIVKLLTQINDRNKVSMFENIYTRAVSQAKAKERVGPDVIAEYENLVEMFKNQGNPQQSQDLEHILTELKAINASRKENDVLKDRKERFDKGELQ
tara:strand:- start:3136 stop:8826 length:5691 start_codon:yes stop_codon:yes gene_type:complete